MFPMLFEMDNESAEMKMDSSKPDSSANVDGLFTKISLSAMFEGKISRAFGMEFTFFAVLLIFQMACLRKQSKEKRTKYIWI